MSETDLSIGELIHQYRSAQKITLEQLASATKIRELLIKKIENNDFSNQPLSPYTRGHIRSIGNVLGIESKLVSQVISNYENQFEKIETTLLANNSHNYSRPKRNLPSISFKSISLVAVIVLFAMFAFPVISSFMRAHHSAKISNNNSQLSKVDTNTQSANGINTNNSGAILANASSGVKLVVTGLQSKSWLGVQDASGNQIFSGFITPGQTQSFSDPSFLAVAIGNAGAINLNVNGKDLGTPGTIGQVVHLNLTPDINTSNLAKG